MEPLLSSPMFPFAVGGLVLLVVAGVAGFALTRLRRSDTDERLEQFVGGAGTAHDDSEQQSQSAQVLDNVDKVVSAGKQGSKMAGALARADLKLRVVEFMAIKGASALVGALLGALLASPYGFAATILTSIIAGVVFTIFPDFYVGMRAGGRLKSFNAQLGDTITMMSNALRGGYSFLQTMDMVSKEAPSPIADEFARVVQEVGLGRPTEEALENLMRRVPSDDLDLLITAVNIQHEVGGNLAQILDTIGHTIRERVRIKGEIQTLTAQGRISGYVITALPIGLAMYIGVVNPDYMMPMFEFGFPPQHWCCLPVTSLFMIFLGYVAIMKIVDIEV